MLRASVRAADHNATKVAPRGKSCADVARRFSTNLCVITGKHVQKSHISYGQTCRRGQARIKFDSSEILDDSPRFFPHVSVSMCFSRLLPSVNNHSVSVAPRGHSRRRGGPWPGFAPRTLARDGRRRDPPRGFRARHVHAVGPQQVLDRTAVRHPRGVELDTGRAGAASPRERRVHHPSISRAQAPRASGYSATRSGSCWSSPPRAHEGRSSTAITSASSRASAE